MKKVKIIVGKGGSVPIGGPEGEWKKVFYQVEAVVEEGEDPEAARLGLEHMIDHWIEEALAPGYPITGVPKLDLGDLDELPWMTFKTKVPAEPGHAGWMKNPLAWDNFDNDVAAELAKAIARAGGKLVLGDCTYTLSGDNDKFLGRHPQRVERAKKAEKNSNPKGPQTPHEKMDENLNRIREGAERMGLRQW